MQRRGRGKVIALCGPDGTGKSTIAAALAERIDGPVIEIHHRPEALPYPAVEPGRDFTTPHRDPPHGRLRSLAKVLYLYLDWLVGWMWRIAPHRRRGGWVVIQRPWWDMVVDRARYRLDLPRPLLRAMGRLLPSPDLTVLLEGPPEVIRSRKGELSEGELRQQGRAWRDVLDREGAVVVDVDQPVQACVEEVITAIRTRSSQPDLAAVRAGRWIVPRGPRHAVMTATSIYQPMHTRGKVLRAAGRIAAGVGAARALPGAEPPADVIDQVRPWLPDQGTIAAQRLRDDRWFVLTIGPGGRPEAAIKLGLSTQARASLQAEHDSLDVVGRSLSGPVAVPRLRHHGDGIMVTDPIPWRPRRRPLQLPDPVAHRLGVMFAMEGAGNGTGRIHGDVAPWNILWDGERWFLLDWEESRPDGIPYFDVFHHFVQSHALLGSPPAEGIVAGLHGVGPVGRALRQFARGSGIGLDLAEEAFGDYLSLSAAWIDPTSRGYEIAMARREALHRLVAEKAVGR